MIAEVSLIIEEIFGLWRFLFKNAVVSYLTSKKDLCF